MANGNKIDRIRDLSELRRPLTQSEEGQAKYLHSRMRLGDLWWIPDAVTGFSKDRHPWVVVRPYTPHIASVSVCPRTSSIKASPGQGIQTPANILDGLDRSGDIMLLLRRTLPAMSFRDYDYMGWLPDVWSHKVDSGYRSMTGNRGAE